MVRGIGSCTPSCPQSLKDLGTYVKEHPIKAVGRVVGIAAAGTVVAVALAPVSPALNGSNSSCVQLCMGYNR